MVGSITVRAQGCEAVSVAHQHTALYSVGKRGSVTAVMFYCYWTVPSGRNAHLVFQSGMV